MSNYFKTFLIFIFIFFYVEVVSAQVAHVIPAPQQVEMKRGVLTISSSDNIAVSGVGDLPVARILSRNIFLKTGIKLSCKESAGSSTAIEFVIDSTLSDQAYAIHVDKKARVTAASYEGFTLGASSLLQLITKEDGNLKLPKLEINDSPELKFRGVLLDLARAWIPAHVVHQTLDLMHLYKFNHLHLHLSDMESYVLPSRTFKNLPSVNRDGSRRHYTPGEIKEIVKHAHELGIILIPEIDVPGHAGQLVSKVPEVFASKDPNTGEYRRAGMVNMVSEKTYEGYEALVVEMIELFPHSPYIHLGGDEVWARPLLSDPGYQDYCKKHHLKLAMEGNLEELFVHFIGRVNAIVNKHHRQSIIWEGFAGDGTENAPLPKNMIVNAWNTSYQTPQSLIKNGYDIINATWMPLYIVPTQNRVTSQEKAFAWNYRKFDHWKNSIPTIQLADDQPVIGAQICFWEHKHELVMPLLSELMPVISQRIWNPAGGETFEDFKQVLTPVQEGIKNVIEPVEISDQGLLPGSRRNFADSVCISMQSSIPGTIRYTVHNSYDDFPNGKSKEYSSPFYISETTTVSAQLFAEDNSPLGGVTQKRYYKIEPAYTFQAYSVKEGFNWPDMPDFSTLQSDRWGFIGFTSPDRVAEINRTFPDIKPLGHVDTRPEDLWNSYAIVMKGQLQLPEDGTYQIKLRAKDGGGELYLDEFLIARNLVLGEENLVKVDLKKGIFPFAIHYFYRFVFNELNIMIKRPGANAFEPFESFVLPISQHKEVDEVSHLFRQPVSIYPAQLANWNLAINKPVSTTAPVEGGMFARYIVDGNTGNASGWHTGPFPQSLEIDLESPHVIDRIKVVPYYDGRRYYQYVIGVSSDGIDWQEVVDRSQTTQVAPKEGLEHRIKPTLARYIKLRVLKNSVNRGVHINEIMVFEAPKKE